MMTLKMLLIPLLLLFSRVSEALVPPSPLIVLPNVTQSLEEDEPLDDTSLDIAVRLDNVSTGPTASSLAVFNSSLASTNISTEIKYDCQDRYGSNLNLGSCQTAALSIQYRLERPGTWGPRGNPIRYDFPLPQRWVSCT